MQVLIVGSGGREHAMAWKVAQSAEVSKVWVAPGNAGTAQEHKVENIDIAADDIEQLLKFAKQHAIDLTIIGPEAPLALGIVDQFKKAKLDCFGPTQKAAQLESSKAYCKEFMNKYNIPTAAHATFEDADRALDYLKSQQIPIVIKADGLAAGKGVVVAQTFDEARKAIKDMLTAEKFGEASARIVIEEFLAGEELSYIVMSDGKHILPLASSQDHKRRDDGDNGPNTGGMGAYSPSPLMNETLEQRILQEVIQPTIIGLKKNGSPYTGFLYAGLMIDDQGNPKVLEFNCRLGDPETQPIMLRLQSDLVSLCQHALQKKLHKCDVQWDSRPAIGVVIAAGGYPQSYEKGYIIEGLDSINDPDCKVFHAGTTNNEDNIVTNGGRVVAVTALGDDIQLAQQRAYQNVEKIHWQDCFYRHDIGYRALQKLSLQAQ